jgi:hypothetical protein
MDPRLRTAVDASVSWYDDVFALHHIPVQRADGLWSALGPPPPWHSAVKTLRPGIETERVARAMRGFEHGTVADSFGDLDLAHDGFGVLFDATWLHHEPDAGTGTLPESWSVVDTAVELDDWATAHDYAGVLPPAVLDDTRFRILACRRDGRLVGGAITHAGPGTVGLSNVWGTEGVAVFDEVLVAVSALHPGLAVTDYAWGDDRDAMVAAGFTPVGPQRVWSR